MGRYSSSSPKPKDMKRVFEPCEGPLFYLFALGKTYEQGDWPLRAQLAAQLPAGSRQADLISFQAKMWGQAFLATQVMATGRGSG